MRLVCFSIMLGLFIFSGNAECPNDFFDNPSNCCVDCTCTLCGDIQCCVGSPPTYTEAACALGGNNTCGTTGGGPTCSTYWENTSLSGSDRGDGLPSDCIPIDGGLGFLVAGGFGIAAIGIRRRKDVLELERV